MRKNWTIQEESEAKKEYLLMVDTLKDSEEFSKDWNGNWEDELREVFGHKKTKVKGDKTKYMKYWLENQALFNDLDNWNKIDNKEETDEYF